jgi:hypothetical protein
VNSEASVESRNQFSGEGRRRHTEESKLKFMYCKIVKQVTVSLPGEYSNKPSVKFRTHNLFVALPPNTRQYYGITALYCRKVKWYKRVY